MYPELFELPFIGITVKSYGLIMVMGFLAAVALVVRNAWQVIAIATTRVTTKIFIFMSFSLIKVYNYLSKSELGEL